MDRAIDVLAAKERLLVFTGAGISTESGIPDFRGPEGVWTRVDPADFTIDRYLADADVRRRSWEMRSRSGVLEAEPNAGHRALARLWESGRMLGCVTQNIDGLHVAAGLPEDAVIELHGNARTSVCVQCDWTDDTTSVVARFESGERDPRCPECGAVVKVDVVFFGEMMPADAMTRAMAMAAACDAVIAVGSTLSVFPAAYVPMTAVESGAPLVIINHGATEMDDLATVVIDQPAGEALGAFADALA